MEQGGLGLLDALDNLSAIIDADSLDALELRDGNHLVLKNVVDEESGEVIPDVGMDQETLDVIRQTFQSVQLHLHHFYQKLKQQGERREFIEGMNSMMVLVGEAAHKLEKGNVLFKKYLGDMPEYIELQHFYRDKIIKELLQHGEEEQVQALLTAQSQRTAYPLNSLSELKADEIYELFYLKTEEGDDFFSPELAKRIKLACDFGLDAEVSTGEDPLVQVKNWEDLARQQAAHRVLDRIQPALKRYFAEKMHRRDHGLVTQVNSCMMALMLAAQPHQLLRQFSVKGCTAYYQDFILFLRDILQNQEYQMLRLSPDPERQAIKAPLLSLMQEIIDAFFHSTPYRDEIWGFLTKVVCAGESTKVMSSQLLRRLFDKLEQVLQQHPNGPIFKALDLIRAEDEVRYFDPLLLGCLPEQEAVLQKGSWRVSVIRMGSPTIQHVIHQAYVTAEFKEYLRGLPGVALFVNLQNRTSWQECARARAIEQLGQYAEFSDKLLVVTLPVATEFYMQTGIYALLEQADVFIEQLLQHTQDESTGCFFSPQLHQKILGPFLKKLVEAIHVSYFDRQKILNADERRVFISLVFNFLILKALEITHTQELIVSSKDGLDLSIMEVMQLLLLLRSAPHQECVKPLLSLLFGPILLTREREMVSLCCDRLVASLQQIEKHPQGLQALKELFQGETLSLEARVPGALDAGA